MKPRVAVVRTSPASVLADVRRAMELAGAPEALTPGPDVLLKINISWHHFFPACSTTPWQLDGVIRALRGMGHPTDRLAACHNRTVVVDARLGERENRHLPVVQAHGLRNIHLYEPQVEWIHIRDAVGGLADRFLALNQVYPDGFHIPKLFLGAHVVHLPTVKTHVFTTTTGAMKNAFGGLLNERRHWTHPVIHETLVDLLRIQRRIHPGIFAVMDGTWAGDGPGPRCMTPHVKNVLLASSDSAAIDAVAARMMGFDPLSIRYLRLAQEARLGVADPAEIEIVGDADAAAENWRFVGPFRRMTFASRMQHRIYWGALKRPVEWTLKTWLAPWAYVASVLYHDLFWYPTHLRRIREVYQSPWGRLFANWERLTLPPDDLSTPGWSDPGPAPSVGPRRTAALRLTWRLLRQAVGEGAASDRPRADLARPA